MAETGTLSGRTRGMGEIVEVAGKVTELAPFGHTLAELASERPEIVGLTADMGRYSDILPFRDTHPGRFFNVGMAEQNLIMMAAGLAKTGKIAYCTTYSVFITRRAYDFVAIACAHSMANVKIFAGMPGLVNGYGATHQATEDLNMMRGIADLTIIDPCDATELKQVVRAVADIPGTVYVRNLRGKVPVELGDDYRFELGKARVLRPGRDVGIIATGYMSARGLDAARAAQEKGVDAGLLRTGGRGGGGCRGRLRDPQGGDADVGRSDGDPGRRAVRRSARSRHAASTPDAPRAADRRLHRRPTDARAGFRPG